MGSGQWGWEHQGGQYGGGEMGSGQWGRERQGGQYGGAWGGYPSGDDPSRGSQYGQHRGSGQGSFAGRGPKGYQRSDERIREEVSELLTRDPDVDPGDVEVTVTGGEVTLTGTVDSRHTKRRIEDLLEDISGVKELNNQIRVKSSKQGEGPSSGSSSGSGSHSTAGSSRSREGESRGSFSKS
jgi:hypothetical protein